MKKISVFSAVLLISIFSALNVFSQVSGSVFRDYNKNGQKDNGAGFNEPFVAGIQVKAFNSANVQLGTTQTTNASGAYSFNAATIPSGTAVRIEFSGLASGDYSSANGTENGTNVQFVTAPGNNINYAVNAPENYWNNIANPTPTFLVVVQQRGEANAGGYLANSPTVIQSNTQLTGPYNPANSNTPATGTMTTVATHQQTGSVFGLAVQRKQERYFAAAYLRRATDIGPRGPGGIYLFGRSGVNFSLTGSFSLQGVVPSNGGGALDFGTVNRVYGAGNAANNNYLANTANWPGESRDIDAFAKAGTMSYGDIEADPNSDKVYMVNLFQRRLIVFNGTAASATLNGATPATLAPFTTAYDIMSLPGIPTPTGSGNNIRPYAIKIYNGKGYLGVVSDAMNTQNDGHLRGYILEFDPNNIAAGFTTVLTINFNTWPTGGTRYWKPWATTWAQAGGTGGGTSPRDYPTPIIAGIEFNEDGSMDIGIKDRWGDQGGKFEFNPEAGATGHTQCSINGDLLHACWTGTAWAIEGTGGACTQPATNTNGGGAANSFGSGYSYGNTGREWYADRSGDGGSENAIGGMTKLMGSGIITTTIYDPMGMGESNGSNYWSTQGIQYSNVTTGAKAQIARVLPSNLNELDKANGMGDIEFLAEEQPIQIGNRIWLDTNGNGIQDAGETTAGVPNNTTVTLRSPGVNGIYGDSDDQTWTTTTDAAGNYYFSTLSSADNRKPATWAGVGNVILPGYDYRIEVGVPAGNRVSVTDAAGNSFDNIDNDAAILSGTTAYVNVNTNNVNHNYDFGFKTLASLGDKVWRDVDKDGVQDAGEPGVAGVTVTLYNSGGTAVATTTTDAYGNYLFDNLTPGNYTVGFTLPANYAFTTSTGTSEIDATNSDVNATTGLTTTVTLSSGETQTNVDAGIIFSEPATNSIGNRVWFDNGAGGGTANDGVQNGNEPGVSGVTVTLYDNGGNPVATTVTDANGNYIFTGLPANTNYSVGITPPIGMLLTTGTATSTGNATTNSDFSQTTFRTSTFSSGPAGNQITGIDAGLVGQPASSASLGDKVWNDLNNNGIQDAGEPGVPGVTVNLYRDSNGDGVINGAEASTPYLTTITDAFGNYIFNNLPAAVGGTKYQAGFVLPGGYNFVTPNTGANDFLDSDANTQPGGLTGVYNIIPGQRDISVDAGLVLASPAGTSVIGDKVWFDADQDGVQDADETGVAGVTVTLYNSSGSPIATTVTDANGNYTFANLAAGNYSVGFSNLPQGYSFTSSTGTTSASGSTDSDANPGTGRTAQFALGAAQTLTGLDAGLISGVPSGLGSIGNKVWWDLDNDNIQDAGEPGVPNAIVNLDYDLNGDGDFADAGEAGYKSTTTNGLGEYLFTGLPAGNYQVRFSALPAVATAVTQNSGADDAVDSDGGAISSGTSTTPVYTLAAGEDNLTVDLGIENPAKGSFGDRVWVDNGMGGGTANDGIQNGTEPGIAGVMVTLVNAAGQPVDRTGAVTANPITTVTDANGYYAFADLTAGASFAAKFSNLPAGFDFTSKAGLGGGDNNRSDADLTNGLTPAITIVANTHNTTLDAGISSTRASLGNFVWMDNDGDGVQDAGEPGIPGVTVTLYRPGFGPDGIAGNGDDAQAVASMITDQNGNYLFSNLIPGTYEVEFSTIPGGTVFTQRNTPGDNGNNTNSDAVPQAGNPSVGRTAGITLTAGEVETSVDAGLFIPRAVIGNYVWSDLNSDGVQNANEPGAPGIMVSLIDGGGNTVAVAVTDANGGYSFPNVAPGTYSLSFSNLPTGTSFTTPNQTGSGGNDNNDSDVIGTTVTGIVVTTTTVNLSFDAGIVGLAILPVKMQFTATKAGANVQLTSRILSETGIEKYEFEHSVDGINFSTIATYLADSRTLYEKLHVQPAPGLNYYRVKATNIDGKIEYSEVRIVLFNTNDKIQVFPNPATDKVNIRLPENWQGKSVKIEITNTNGQLVLSKVYNQASQVETIGTGNLANGQYLIILTDSKGVRVVEKLMVRK